MNFCQAARLPGTCPNPPWRQLRIPLLEPVLCPIFHQGSMFCRVQRMPGDLSSAGLVHLPPRGLGRSVEGPHSGWVSLLRHCHPQPHRKWFFLFFPLSPSKALHAHSPVVTVGPIAGWASASGSTGSLWRMEFWKNGCKCSCG